MSQARSGYQRSVPGLIGAIVAALAVIVAIWLLSRFQQRDVADPVDTVDYTTQLQAARAQAPFDVLAPDAVPDSWRATTVEWDAVGPEVAWHLGFLTSDSTGADYVGVEQGNAPAGEFVPEVTPASTPGDDVDVDGVAWRSLTSDFGDETALVLEGDGVTTVVTGTASVDELADFAASLTPN